MIKAETKKTKRTVAIDSCRRTSNPYVNFMEKMLRDKSVGGEFVTTHFRGAYLFCSCFLQKPPVVYKHFIYLKFKEIEIYNRNVEEKMDKFHLPSNMDMEILQNEDLCYFSELWD